LAAALALLAPVREVAARVLETSSGPVTAETVADGLEYPWGMAVLPDGGLLVTERPGRLRIVSADGKLSDPLEGVPEVFAEEEGGLLGLFSKGQGGLLDVALDPDFGTNRLIYLSFAEAGEEGASTAAARARLSEDRTGLEELGVIFRQEPKMGGSKHFGSRLAFAPDGTLFITTGERFRFDPAQDLGSHLGKVIRIRPDGSVPGDNPFVEKEGAQPEIWSYGHRNIEAAAIHPQTGALWIGEMGPSGGDELNVPEAGGNYGWPLVSWGDHYSGRQIPDPPNRPDLKGSRHQWTPVISPSGMLFYAGSAFPAWRGDLMIGSLTQEALVRIGLEKGKVSGEEKIALGARIRDVELAPGGALYLLTDEANGRLLKLAPAPSE
jgi:glucose/arabinose dehydrogenase